METLFSQDQVPLADRLRPKDFSQFVGQEHLTGGDGLITRLLKTKTLPSLIFWGPPGSGKTTLAQLIAKTSGYQFIPLSAVSVGVSEVRKIIKEAKKNFEMGKKTILFIDEIHHFSKSQQDAFLPYIEKGIIIFIGATTENPSFEVIGPLLSRTRTLVLKELDKKALTKILERALKDEERGLGKLKIKLEEEAQEILLQSAGGDARLLLNVLEMAVALASPRKRVTKKEIIKALQHRALVYDRAGEAHYNTISAFIKSMRGSDADAALYYLARMLEAGEDPLFIARRMIIFASEDVGLADPKALLLAVAALQAVEKVGLPEAAINLAHVVCYLALTKKSRASYDALMKAKEAARAFPDEPVPLLLRNAPTKLMKDLGYGTYKWPGTEGFEEQEYLPEKLKGYKFLDLKNLIKKPKEKS